MKYIMNYIKVFTFMCVILSCETEEEYDPGMPKPSAALYTTTTNTRIVNASPGAKLGAVQPPVVQFAFNNILQLANQSLPQSGTNLPVEVSYTSTGTSYRGILAAAASQVRYLSSTGASMGSLTTNYYQGRSYTTFLIDSTTRAAGMRVIQLEDNLAAPAAGQVKIRFLHFAPNAPEVAITNAADSSVVFSPRTYAQTSRTIAGVSTNFGNFTSIPAGTYDLDVRNNVAADKAIVLALEDVVLTAGKIYTVYARGFLGGAGDQAINATIILHN